MNQRELYRFGATAVALMLLKPIHASETSVSTDAVTDPAMIRAAAERAVRASAGETNGNVTVTIDTLDGRLRLAQCQSPLQSFIVSNSLAGDRVTVGVRCDTSNRWTIYLGATVSTRMPVLIALRALATGAELDATSFSATTRQVPGLSNRYVSDPAQLTGQRLRRSIAIGEALSADALLTAPIVHRGQQITLLAHASGTDVRVTVVALADGKPDERIRVQNPSSQRIVEATVRSSQLVEVSL